MYRGLLPRGLTEDDLSSDEDNGQGEDVEDKGMERVGDERENFSESLTSAEGNTTSVVEAEEIHAARDADSDSPTCSIAGVSQEMWQKFQDQRQKLEEMKTMKVPQKRKRKRREHKKEADLEESAETGEYQEAREKHWDELKQYFGVNDRFHPPAYSNPSQKSGLEKSIERAIAEGDIAKAEEMSNRLATRELAVNIAKATECRDFVRHKQEEEALRAMQKKKKVAWGFEAKKRWETKSNMGFI
ncbi:protein FAM204A isoform X2 [Antennarius striatus]|uniref:protein FAM204A isoform X2 n=1 Tax=Antennarius striatus TaxID=241820 RepID=UPI0035AEF182